MGYAAECDTHVNYYCSDIVREKLTQAAFKKVYTNQTHYFTVTLGYSEIQVFPNRHFISSHVLALEHFIFRLQQSFGFTQQ